MSKNSLIFSIGLAALLAGCATTPIDNDDAVEVFANRVTAAKFLLPAPDAGTVTIKRDSGFLGGACLTRIFVDGKPVASLDTAQKVVLFMPAGSYVLSALPNNPCGGGLTELHTQVGAGEAKNFRVGNNGQGGPVLQPTAF